MLKKLATIIIASAFAMAVYVPSATACPGSDMQVAEKKKDDKKKESKKVTKKTNKKKKKGDKKKSSKKTSKG